MTNIEDHNRVDRSQQDLDMMDFSDDELIGLDPEVVEG